MLFLSLFFMLQARAEDLSLPEGFFRNNSIESRQVVKIDQCPRIKADHKLFLIKTWNGGNASAVAATSNKKKKKRSKSTSLAVKISNELSSVLSEIVADEQVDILINDECGTAVANTVMERYGKKLKVLCSEDGKFSSMIPKIKEIKTEKPILVLSSKMDEFEFLKLNQSEKWNCEAYEPKSFKKIRF
jgi:hypothetical protein